MRRLAPLVAVVLAVAGVATLRPGLESGACAQGDAVVPRNDCEEGGGEVFADQACDATRTSFRSVAVRPVGRGLRFSFTRRVDRQVTIDVFQTSIGRRVLNGKRVVRIVTNTSPARWSGRAARNGFLFARFRIVDEDRRVDTRRVTLRRRGGRFRVVRPFHRATSCATVTAFKLGAPEFGGRRSRALGISFRLAQPGRVGVEVLRRGRVVRRFAATERPAFRIERLRLSARGLRRGRYEVRLTFTSGNISQRSSLYAQRL